MTGIVKDADNGASIIYRGVFGMKFRNAYAVGHETSYDFISFLNSKYLSRSIWEK
jgi:hypothetical protein